MATPSRRARRQVRRSTRLAPDTPSTCPQTSYLLAPDTLPWLVSYTLATLDSCKGDTDTPRHPQQLPGSDLVRDQRLGLDTGHRLDYRHTRHGPKPQYKLVPLVQLVPRLDTLAPDAHRARGVTPPAVTPSADNPTRHPQQTTPAPGPCHGKTAQLAAWDR